MNMKDMIQRMTDLESSAKQELTENVNECGDMPMNPPMDQGSPVSMNVNISASGKDHVADLVDMMKNAGLNTAAPVSQEMMPMRMDMEKFRSIVDKPETDGKLDLDIDGDRQPDFDTEELDIEEDAMEDKKSKILDWAKKYETRIGNNGDTLPEGYLRYLISTGIFSDAYDQDETAKAEKMIGKPYTEWEYDDQAKALEMMPITKAMFDEIEKITGTSGEDAAEMVADVMDNMDEGLEEVVVGGNAKPEDPDSVFARLMSDISEIQNAAMDDNDMADDIADELGDYLRNGDAPKGSHYEKAIGIVMDAIHDGPQAQAEAAEEAISFLHSAEEEARGNNEGYENEPDPDYRDHHHMTKDLSGGLNRQKKAYPAAQDGDNAMAAKIKEQLLAALSEKKMPMGPGPDGKKGTDDDKPAFLNQKTGAKKSKSDKKDGGMTDKQKKYFGKK